LEKKAREGGEWFSEMKGKDKKRQRKDSWEKIRESKYNKWYKKVKGVDLSEYLRKEGGGEK